MLWNACNGEIELGGTTMDYVSFGHGENVLIVLPGLSDGLATVKGKALLLAPPYRPYLDRFTVYMFSRKNELPADYSIRGMARDQAEALELLGLDKVSVLGVSEGGMIAQQLAADCPGMIDKLVIAVSAPCVNPMIRECIAAWKDCAARDDHKQLMIDTAERSYSEKYLKKYRRIYPLLGRLGKPADYGRFLANADAILGFDAREELHRITAPTLIIGGREDRIVGIDASCEMQRLIAGSELYVYEGLGHAAYEEAGDFYERVFAFLGADRAEKDRS